MILDISNFNYLRIVIINVHSEICFNKVDSIEINHLINI